MDNKNKPRFFDLEEHREGPEAIWIDPTNSPSKRIFHYFQKIIIIIVLTAIAGASLYYIYLYLVKQDRRIVAINSTPLSGKVREEKVLPPSVKEPQQEEFIEKKVRKIIKEDREALVKRGDTFLGLLNFYYHGYDKELQKKVKAANPRIKNFSSLMIGQTLTLPDVEEEVEIIEKIPVNKKNETQFVQTGIVISTHEGQRDKHWLRIKGKIINKNETEYDFIKVNVDYLDDERNVICSDFTYAVGETPLKPGEEKSFFIMSRNDKKITNYELFLDYY